MRRALAIYEGLNRRDPDPLHHERLAHTFNCLGQVYWRGGQLREAAIAFERADVISQRLPDRNVGGYESYERFRLRGAVLSNLALPARESGDFERSIDLLDRAIASQQHALELSPENYWGQNYLFSHHVRRAETFLLAGRCVEAADAVEAMLSVSPDSMQASHEAAELLLRCADSHLTPRDEAQGSHLAPRDEASPSAAPSASAAAYRTRARELITKAHRSQAQHHGRRPLRVVPAHLSRRVPP